MLRIRTRANNSLLAMVRGGHRRQQGASNDSVLPRHRLDDDVLDRHVAVAVFVGGTDTLDLVHDVQPLDHLAKDAVADAVLRPGAVEEVVLLDIDEELGRGAVRGRSSRAMAMVPRLFARPLVDSFLIGRCVGFWRMPGSKPPPWS